MATVLTLPHAFIMSIISGAIFVGGFIVMSRNTSSSVKELQVTVNSTNTKLDSVAMTLNSMQIEQKYQAEIGKRELDILSQRLSIVENKIEQKGKNHASIN
jgi:hypothetical protein